MIIAVGSDHAGFELKKILTGFLRKEKYKVLDVGAYNQKPSDYPDFARKVGLALLHGAAKRGILICGSGVGASVAANKLPGIRAGLCHDTYSAHQGVEHDDMNVLVLGSRVVGVEIAKELAKVFLKASFNKEPRHVRRLEKVKMLEVRYGNANSKS